MGFASRSLTSRINISTVSKLRLPTIHDTIGLETAKMLRAPAPTTLTPNDSERTLRIWLSDTADSWPPTRTGLKGKSPSLFLVWLHYVEAHASDDNDSYDEGNSRPIHLN